MRLNLEKYAFGVKVGKFLGFMIFERDVEANHEKIRAILDMPSSRTTKDIQHLMGRIVALNRFVPRWQINVYLSSRH